MCCSKRDAPYHEPQHPSMEIDSKRTAMEEASLLIRYIPEDKPQFVAWLRYRPLAPQTDDCESSSGRTRKSLEQLVEAVVMQEEAASHKGSVRVMDIGNKQQDANACNDLSFELCRFTSSFTS
ncbi:unnamed protein product [Arctogadus glacialis]